MRAALSLTQPCNDILKRDVARELKLSQQFRKIAAQILGQVSRQGHGWPVRRPVRLATANFFNKSGHAVLVGMLGQHARPASHGQLTPFVGARQVVGDCVEQFRHGCECRKFIFAEKFRQESTPIHQLKSPATGDLKRARIDEISGRDQFFRLHAGMQIEVDGRSIENFHGLFRLNSRSAILKKRRQRNFTVPIRSPNLEIKVRKLAERPPPVGIACSHERDG